MELAQNQASLLDPKDMMKQPIAENTIDHLVAEWQARRVALNKNRVHTLFTRALLGWAQDFQGCVQFDQHAITSSEHRGKSPGPRRYVQDAAAIGQAAKNLFHRSLLAPINPVPGSVVEARGVFFRLRRVSKAVAITFDGRHVSQNRRQRKRSTTHLNRNHARLRAEAELGSS